MGWKVKCIWKSTFPFVHAEDCNALETCIKQIAGKLNGSVLMLLKEGQSDLGLAYTFGLPPEVLVSDNSCYCHVAGLCKPRPFWQLHMDPCSSCTIMSQSEPREGTSY